MLPAFLLPETAVTANGQGPVFEFPAPPAGKLFQVTLGITEVVEQESLDVSIFGSADGESFPPKALIAFPQKFYTGAATMLLDLKDPLAVRFLRVSWKMNRWGRGDLTPHFKFYVYIDAVES